MTLDDVREAQSIVHKAKNAVAISGYPPAIRLEVIAYLNRIDRRLLDRGAAVLSWGR